MPTDDGLQDGILDAWRTNARLMTFLIEHLPPILWAAKVPGMPLRTIRMICGHIHNSPCSWIKTLGKEHGIAVPPSVNRHTATRRELLPALRRSARGILSLLNLGCDHRGQLPPSRAYMWRNLPLDVAHILTYFVAHEGHHRGQIVLVARQLGHRLPTEVSGGLWNWTQRAKEADLSGG